MRAEETSERGDLLIDDLRLLGRELEAGRREWFPDDRQLSEPAAAGFDRRVELAVGSAIDHVATLTSPDASVSDRQRAAFVALSEIQGIEAEVAGVQAAAQAHAPATGGSGSTSSGPLAWIASHLMPLIKKISAQLWQLIATLLSPKEWKVKGTIGAGPFGLASAELEITFG